MNRLAVVLLAALATLPQPVAGQTVSAFSNDDKALFLFKLMLFVRWPADAFQNPSEALRVQIIGPDPFDGSLDRLLAGKLVDQRRIVVTHTAVPTAAPFSACALRLDHRRRKARTTTGLLLSRAGAHRV